MDNCIQFLDSDEIPCRNIQYENFDNPSRFDHLEFKKVIQSNFSSEQFRFPDDYSTSYTATNTGKFRVGPQQKFVSRYANFNNNFGSVLVYHNLGSGKCFAYNTPILMYDGSIKRVQDVKVGDLVMGDDNTHRTVQSLGRGIQEMYEINIPCTGDNFICNKDHILCLRDNSNNIIHIEVGNYIKLSNEKRLSLKIYHSMIDFDKKYFRHLDISPYEYGKSITIKTKEIPQKYKIQSFINRINLLEGIFENFCAKPYYKECKNIYLHSKINDNPKLKDDILFIIKSLGYKYYLLDSKFILIERTSRKYNEYNFDVVCIGRGNYYGFTVDKNHRFVLGNFIVTHNTCTSILVGEAYKAYRNQSVLFHSNEEFDRRIIVAVPSAVISQFKDELIGKIIEENDKEVLSGCSANVLYNGKQISYKDLNKKKPASPSSILGLIKPSKSSSKSSSKSPSKRNSRTRSINVLKNVQREIDANVEKYWNIMSHQKFINGLFHYSDESNLMKLSKQLQRGGNIVIIDEIQNLISESGILYKKLLDIVRLFSRNNRFIVMSATPIYDKPYEIGLTLNILNPRLYFPDNQKDFNELFIGQRGNNIPFLKNPSLLHWMTYGYISYFSGGNPNYFPAKRIIEMHHPMNDHQYKSYIKALISDTKLKNKKNKEKNADDDDNQDGERNYLSRSRELCNIAFVEDMNDNSKGITVQEKMNSIKRLLTINYETLKGKSETEDIDDHVYNFLNGVSMYSKKIANICGLIYDRCLKYEDIHKGTVLVFSDLYWYGVKSVSTILDIIGFFHIDHSYIKSKNINQIKKDISKLKKQKTYIGTYTIWSGKIPSNEKDNYGKIIREIFNGDDNIHGEYLNVILGTKSIMEGISFKNVRDVHILNPWWNESRLQQVMARAVRYKSHESMSKKMQYVNIYKHYSTISSFPYSSYGDYMREEGAKITPLSSTGKKIEFLKEKGYFTVSIDQHIGRRSKLKKDSSREFELLLKSSAVDCEFNKNANMTRLDTYIIPNYERISDEFGKEMYVVYYENPTTGATYCNPEELRIERERLNEMVLQNPTHKVHNLRKCSKTLLERNDDSQNLSFFTYIIDEDANDVGVNFITNENIDCSLFDSNNRFLYSNRTEKLDEQSLKLFDKLFNKTISFKVNAPWLVDFFFYGHKKFLTDEIEGSDYNNIKSCIKKYIDGIKNKDKKNMVIDSLKNTFDIKESNEKVKKIEELLKIISSDYNSEKMSDIVFGRRRLQDAKDSGDIDEEEEGIIENSIDLVKSFFKFNTNDLDEIIKEYETN